MDKPSGCTATPHPEAPEIAGKELHRLAVILGGMVNQYGQPDWTLDEFLENLSDISEQLSTLGNALSAFSTRSATLRNAPLEELEQANALPSATLPLHERLRPIVEELRKLDYTATATTLNGIANTLATLHPSDRGSER